MALAGNPVVRGCMCSPRAAGAAMASASTRPVAAVIALAP
jgi:hypothetical protein